MDPTWPMRHLSYKKMIAIPLAFALIMAIAIITLGVPLGIEFKGGTLISIKDLNTKPDVNLIETGLKSHFGTDVSVRLLGDRAPWGLDIEIAKSLESDELEKMSEILANYGVGEKFDIQKIGPTVLLSFQEQARLGFIGAFIAIGIVVLFVFRTKVTISTILFSMALDIVGILGLMTILNVPLSLASFSAILMTLGYGVDTNILLSIRVLKRFGGTARDRAGDAMKTGIMMSGTTLAALIALNVFTTASVLKELSSALIFGVASDFLNTWFLNGGLLLMHVERRKKEEYYVST